MTNATVKPTLSRIEQKLDKLTNLMNKKNSKKDDRQENEGPKIDPVDCMCEPSKELLKENEQEKEQSE